MDINDFSEKEVKQRFLKDIEAIINSDDFSGEKHGGTAGFKVTESALFVAPDKKNLIRLIAEISILKIK